MDFYDGNGNKIKISGENGLVVNTDAYENNYNSVFAEKFTATNPDFVYTNCSPSADGLSCSGFCKATFGNEITLNDGKACIRFIYSEDIVIGVFMSATLAFVNTSEKKVGLMSSYMQGSSITQTSANSISFDFEVNKEYELVVERHFWGVTATIKDISGCTEDTYSASMIVGHSNNIVANNLASAGLAVYSGNCIVTGMSFWLPYAGKHIKALILGDSITEGQMSAKTDATCWARRLVFEHFHSNGMTCGVGGSTPSAGLDRFSRLVSMGYAYDYVIVYLCTNDGCTDAQIASKTLAYQGYVNTIKATGAKCIWCMLPEYVGGSSSTSRVNLRNIISSLTDLDALIDFGKVLDTTEQTHPSLEGQTNMFLLADTVLELAGI